MKDHCKIANRYNAGFSLVELSILLLAIGLLLGGILVGQNLIRSAEIRKIGVEYNHYKIAVQDFYNKYQGLPGDMSNATDFWGTDPDGCPGTEADSSLTEETCDGDEDGEVEPVHFTGWISAEQFRFWQQLENADMVSGVYTGVRASVNMQGAEIGTNVPDSTIAAAGWNIMNQQNWGSYYSLSEPRQVFHFGSETGTSTFGPAITPIEAASLDQKLDDGKPAYGLITTWDNTSTIVPNCVTGTNAATALYDAAYEDVACALIFEVGQSL